MCQIRDQSGSVFSFYWRTVLRPNLWEVVFIASLMLFSAIFQMVTIGMVVPLLEAVGSGATASSWVLGTFRSVLLWIGLVPNGNLVVFTVLASASVMFVAHSGFMLLHQYLSAATAEKLRRDTKYRLFQRFLVGSYEDVSNRGRGAVLQDLNAPPSAVYTVIIRLSALFTAVVNGAVMLALMLYLSWWATVLIGLLAIGGIQLTRRVIDSSSRKAGGEIYGLQSRGSQLTVDSIDGLKVVKAYAVQNKLTNQLRLLLQAEARPALRLALFRYLPSFINEIAACAIVLTLGGITLLRPSVGMSFPTLVAFLMAIRQCGSSTASINSNIVELQTLRSSVEVVNSVLNGMTPEEFGVGAVSSISELKLVDVCHRYGSREEVLRGVNLRLRKGTVTAIVGSTGAGKSTIANLILGLYRPSSGSILVDGRDVRSLDLDGWRRRIGYVSQDIFLFNASIRENIVLWNDKISQAEIEWAAGLAQLHEFVSTLPEGYNTVIGDRGLKLSGGQVQRIAIARAIVFKPEILVFDEATSALDNLTERAVYEAMSALRSNAIIIAVAHRLSTIRDADQIVVLESGRIVQVGTHDSLIIQGGSYSRLYETEFVRG